MTDPNHPNLLRIQCPLSWSVPHSKGCKPCSIFDVPRWPWSDRIASSGGEFSLFYWSVARNQYRVNNRSSRSAEAAEYLAKYQLITGQELIWSNSMMYVWSPAHLDDRQRECRFYLHTCKLIPTDEWSLLAGGLVNSELVRWAGSGRWDAGLFKQMWNYNGHCLRLRIARTLLCYVFLEAGDLLVYTDCKTSRTIFWNQKKNVHEKVRRRKLVLISTSFRENHASYLYWRSPSYSKCLFALYICSGQPICKSIFFTYNF